MVMDITKLIDDSENQSDGLELPGRTMFDKTAHAIYARQHNNKDAWILITGDLGDGKSTLSLELMRKISRLNDMKWSLKNNVLFNPSYKDINDVIHTVPKYTTIVVDEAANILNARNWNQRDNIEFNIMGDRVRFRNLCVIFNIRMMKEVDLNFRMGRFFYWIDILKRGIAAVFARDIAHGLKNKGDGYNTEMLLEKLSNLDINDIGSKMAAYESMPNFRGFIYFRPLESRIDNAYQILKEKSDMQQYQQSKEVEMSKQQKEMIMTNLILSLYEKGSSLKEIAETINSGNPDKPISEFKIKKIITRARRSVDKVSDRDLGSEQI